MATQLNNYEQLKTAFQYLSQVLPWSSYRSLSTFGAKRRPISLKTLEKLLAEITYLLYYLFLNDFDCFLSKNVFITNTRNEEEEVKFILIPESEISERTDKFMEIAIQKDFRLISCQDERSCITAMKDSIEQLLQCYSECRLKGLILPTRINDAIIKTQMDEFSYVYFSMIKPKISLFQQTSTFIRVLEETKLFRENAILFKYSNNSVITKVSDSKKCKEELRNVILQFQKQRIMFLKSPSHRMETSHEIIDSYFKKLVLNSIITLSTSFYNEKEDEKVLDCELIKIVKILENKSMEAKALVLNINVEEVPYQFLTPQRLQFMLSNPVGQKNPQKANKEKKMYMNRRINEFEVTYWIMGNELEIKLWTNYTIRLQDIDLVANILSSINFESISYSFDDNAKRTKTADKFIVLMARAHLHPKENPFMTIYQCIDRLIIYSLVIEHDIRLKCELTLQRKEEIHSISMYLLDKMRGLLEELPDL